VLKEKKNWLSTTNSQNTKQASLPILQYNGGGHWYAVAKGTSQQHRQGCKGVR